MTDPACPPGGGAVVRSDQRYGNENMRCFLLVAGVLALAWFLGAAASAPGQAVSATPAERKTIHIVMAFDTQDKDLRLSLEIDEWRMRNLWNRTIPLDR